MIKDLGCINYIQNFIYDRCVLNWRLDTSKFKQNRSLRRNSLVRNLLVQHKSVGGVAMDNDDLFTRDSWMLTFIFIGKP